MAEHMYRDILNQLLMCADMQSEGGFIGRLDLGHLTMVKEFESDD